MQILPPTSPLLALGLAGLTALYLVVSVSWLARQREHYSHLRHSISELGEVGSPIRGAVAWGSFAPTGVLFCLSLLVIRPHLPPAENITHGLLLLGLVGAAYVLSAVFPCDPGAPLYGSVRTMIHNLIGAAEYLGALAGLDLLHRSLEDFASWAPLAAASRFAFLAVAVGFAGTILPTPIRGLFQRIAEGALFGWLVFAGWMVASQP